MHETLHSLLDLLYFLDHNYPLTIKWISAIKTSMGGQRIKQQASHVFHLYTHAKTLLHSIFLPLWQEFYLPTPDLSPAYQRKLTYMEGKKKKSKCLIKTIKHSNW